MTLSSTSCTLTLPYRRRGFGRQAVAFLEEKAREMGVNAVHLEVDRGNDPAFELYRRSGVRRSRSIPDDQMAARCGIVTRPGRYADEREI